MALHPTSCCPTVMKPVMSGYTGKGLSFYIVDGHSGSGAKRGVVLVPDIFGNHPNAYQFADVLAAGGFTVVMPDFFRGTPWPNVWPPNFESDEWKQFYGRITAIDNFVADVDAGAQVLRGLGCTSVGCLGMCWGAKVALGALAAKKVQAAAGPHPSFLDVKDVTNANGPIALLLSKDEGPFLDVKEVLETNAFKNKNVFQRFDDLYHGFLGARGPLEQAFDFNGIGESEVGKRCAEASNIIVNFFKNAL